MKKIYIILSVGFLMSALSSCSDFLDSENLYSTTTDNYYKTPAQIDEAMAGVYNALYAETMLCDEHLLAEVMSDVVFGGGGSDDVQAKNMASFVDPLEDTHKGLWLQTYRGVNRVNAIIENIQVTDYSDSFATPAAAEAFKNNTLGEAYFMRGFLLFRAARLFGGLPLILETVGPFNVGRSSFEETFAQVAQDFTTAISLLPERNIDDFSVTEYGHANLWVAKAYLARTYLHATGYLTNIEKKVTTEIILPDGGTVTKQAVAAHLQDIMNKSGYELTSDFRNLWPYSYINKEADSEVLPWAADNNLAWVGQDGPKSKVGTGNREVMFALRYANAIGWSPNDRYRNWFTLFAGPRKNSLIPFGEGWGWGTIHPVFVNNWSDDDTRKFGSVLRMGVEEEGTDGYSGGVGDHETGYFNKKYAPLQFNKGGSVTGLFYSIYDGAGESSYQLWHAQDFYYLRYADVLLMHSELTGNATGLNQVRRRAYGSNHTDIPYSLEALKTERLHEFAFEGVRWFDLVRWGNFDSSNSYYGIEADVVNEGVSAKHRQTYRAETKGLRPIPESEVVLSNGAYTQNEGW